MIRPATFYGWLLFAAALGGCADREARREVWRGVVASESAKWNAEARSLGIYTACDDSLNLCSVTLSVGGGDMAEPRKPREKKSLADRIAFIEEQEREAREWLDTLAKRKASLIAAERARAQAILDALPKP